MASTATAAPPDQINTNGVNQTIGLLREKTREQHDRLDRTLHIIERLSEPGRRTQLMVAYLKLHRASEAAIAPFLEGVSGLDFSARCRATLLADCIVASEEAAPPARSPVCPPIKTRAEAFGSLYVLEGSSLGGRFILKELARRGVSLDGLRFLDPYGSKAGPRWRSFMGVLEREVNSVEQRSDAVRGALATFDYARRCLSEGN